jgi:hypothetical protein
MLLIDQSLRITDDVYEQDMGNLQSKIGFRFGHGIQIALLIEQRQRLNAGSIRLIRQATRTDAVNGSICWGSMVENNWQFG